MSRSYNRLLRILLCIAVVVPVCAVVAGENPSWRVRMPVVRPLDILPVEEKVNVEKPVKQVASAGRIKRPVRDVIVRSVHAPRVEELPGSVRVSNVDKSGFFNPVDVGFVTRPMSFDSGFVLAGSVPQLTGIAGNGSGLVPGGISAARYGTPAYFSGALLYADASKAKKIIRKQPVMVSSRNVDSEDRYIDPSVSLLPSDTAEERQWKSSENGLFFTTPKRFLGLSGTFVRAVPSLSIMEMFDSNIDYTDLSDFITEITPSLKVDVIGEEMNLKLNANFIYRDYLEQSKFDRYDYNVNLAGKYKFSSTVDAGLSLSHKRYHNLDQNTYEAGGVELDPSIVLKTTATPEVNWRVTERDNITFTNYVDKTDYERALDSDFITNVFSTVWGHILPNEVTTVFAGQMSSFTHFSREIDNFLSDQITFQGIVGFDHQFSPAWKLSVKGGPGFSTADYSSDYEHGRSDNFLYQVRAELGYRRLRFSIVPAIERLVRPGRYGENEIMDQVELYARYDFSEFLKYDTINTWWLNETDGTAGGMKHKASGIFTQHILGWEFEKDWKWLFGFSYNWGRNELTNVTNERFKTWMGLTYSFPTEIN